RQLFRVAQTILQRDDGRVQANERREQFRKLIVGGRFKSDQHNVAHADFIRRPCAFGLNVKVAFETADGHASLPHSVVVGAEQEMNVLPDPAKFGTVETAYRSTADDGDFHWTESIVSCQ